MNSLIVLMYREPLILYYNVRTFASETRLVRGVSVAKCGKKEKNEKVEEWQ